MDVSENFGCMVFNDKTMKERLPKDTYKALKKTIENGVSLDKNIADVVANAMKDWAIEKGVTHFTHWFQPMTGITAEKHDSFISPTADGRVIMEFSGKELIKGEPDASSFPSGGLRVTFEARGYTAWDPTSFAFIKEGTLCIPTIFCSYSGEALDKKTPLLRSVEVLSKQASRIVRLFGHDVSRIVTTVGPEQEYFLINKDLFNKRKDLVYCGRTLFGAKAPKGQELEDHYFGIIKPRVAAFMKDLNDELWKLGILAKTEHNEVAPSQHELAPIFSTTNMATDHNQLTMEMMKRVADKHDLTCLLHEKPFAGVNGSGKHNNWSMSTPNGMNLLEPGDSPEDNAQFLLVLSAIIKAVDDYQDLLRISVASAGNDHRLGANEAPPAVISIFLGEELTAVLESIANGTAYGKKGKEEMTLGVDALPKFTKDTTDRNRTSPFAFTGNKFEFRMLGSSLSISGPNVILNTIVAEALDEFATKLEKASDFTKELNDIVKSTYLNHKRIVFNGNGYDDAWIAEAESRGLSNLKTTVDALPHFVDAKNIALFKKYGIFTEAEIHSRYYILLENYCKTLNIEALTMVEMAKKDILGSVTAYAKDLSDVAVGKKAVGVDTFIETTILNKISALSAEVYKKTEALEKALEGVEAQKDIQAEADYYKDVVFAAMNELREVADQLEAEVSEKYLTYPTYGEMLFSV